MPRVLAAADIGSNTAHLLIASTDGEGVQRLNNQNEWIALGEAVAKQGVIPKPQTDALVKAMADFRRLAQSYKAQEMYIFATEAMRAAANHAEVLERIRAETGVRVEIIPPEREAELSLRGVMLDSASTHPDLLIEVGGGSVQIGHVSDGVLLDKASLRLGTGRLIADADLRNPCPETAYRRAEAIIDEELSVLPADYRARTVVVSGGVGRGLWRALHPDGEKTVAIEELQYILWVARRLTPERLMVRFNVKLKRAGTFLPGALVYRAILRKVGQDRMFVSEFGVREGAILEMASGRIPSLNPLAGKPPVH